LHILWGGGNYKENNEGGTLGGGPKIVTRKHLSLIRVPGGKLGGKGDNVP